MEQPVPDGRHGDKDGRIAKKHGNTLIATRGSEPLAAPAR
jgi:hypothetical protein